MCNEFGVWWVFLERSTAAKMENDGAWVTARATQLFFLDPRQQSQSDSLDTHNSHVGVAVLVLLAEHHQSFSSLSAFLSVGNGVLAFSQSWPWQHVHLCVPDSSS